MSGGPMRFEIAVCITHEPTDDGPRPMPRPFRTAFDRETREEAEAVVERLFATAAETGMQFYLTTEIRPIREGSPMAGEILPGGGTTIGEMLADVLDLDTWTETRFVTTERVGRRADLPSATVYRFPTPKE